MRPIRPALLIPLGLAAACAVAVTVPAGASAAGKPRYVSTLLPGSDGSSEPRVTVTPNGMRWVDTNQKHTGTEIVYGSADGKHWKQTQGTPPDQTNPTTDVDIVSTHTGRLIASELDFTGINFITAYSDDQGKTWTESNFTTYADTDRQWFAVGPDDATTHQPRVYLLFHNLLSGAASHNMWVSTSTDGGANFGEPVPVSTPPQQDWLDLQCADSGGPSNIFYDKKTDRVMVVFGTRSSPVGGCAASPVEINVVAANRVWVVAAPAQSTEQPTSWTPHLAVNDTGPPAHIVGMQLAPGTSDTSGNVYVAYPESVHDYPDYDGAAIKVVHAAASNLDKWSAPSVVAPAGGVGNVLPHVIAGAPGKVAVAYYHGFKANGKIQWRSFASESIDALSAHPHWASAQVSGVPVEPSQTSSQLMGACNQGQEATLNGFACGRAADVYGIALDNCSNLVLTWPAQAGLQSDGTYTTQQVGGPSLGNGHCSGTGSAGARAAIVSLPLVAVLARRRRLVPGASQRA